MIQQEETINTIIRKLDALGIECFNVSIWYIKIYLFYFRDIIVCIYE